MDERFTLRLIAGWKALKALAAFVGGWAFLGVADRAAALSAALLVRVGVDVDRGWVSTVLASAMDERALVVALVGTAYAAVRGTEAWGLWRDRAWAEAFGAGSGAVYLPFEVAALWESPSLGPLILLLCNLAIVVFLLRRLWRRTRAGDGSASAALALGADDVAIDEAIARR